MPPLIGQEEETRNNKNKSNRRIEKIISKCREDEARVQDRE
jgi:hypothetical protein